MKYTLTEVEEIPQDGRSSRVPVGFYEDILKVFLENQYRKAKVEVEGKNPDTIHRRLDIHAPDGVSVISRGDGVYLRNNYLVIRDEQ
jgi:hypothetical protein